MEGLRRFFSRGSGGCQAEGGAAWDRGEAHPFLLTLDAPEYNGAAGDGALQGFLGRRYGTAIYRRLPDETLRHQISQTVIIRACLESGNPRLERAVGRAFRLRKAGRPTKLLKQP